MSSMLKQVKDFMQNIESGYDFTIEISKENETIDLVEENEWEVIRVVEVIVGYHKDSLAEVGEYLNNNNLKYHLRELD